MKEAWKIPGYGWKNSSGPAARGGAAAKEKVMGLEVASARIHRMRGLRKALKKKGIEDVCPGGKAAVRTSVRSSLVSGSKR